MHHGTASRGAVWHAALFSPQHAAI